ncbi:MAG: hypothetical protein ACRD2L_09490, partial [Terriglobia bacterium]
FLSLSWLWQGAGPFGFALSFLTARITALVISWMLFRLESAKRNFAAFSPRAGFGFSPSGSSNTL